jgi:hypothetical protein
MAKPARLVSTAAIIPIVFSLIGTALANDAAPSIPFTSNPLCLLNVIILAAAISMTFLSRLNNWDWDTMHFGASLFHFASVTLICLIPCLCVVFYSTLSTPAKAFIFIFYFVAHAAWCRRFIKVYRIIYNDPEAIKLLYQEEEDAIYYMQQTDKYFLEKKYKFDQSPKDRYFLISMLLSFSLLAFSDTVKATVGLPFIHIFFLIGTLPISMMTAGLVTRAWLVFYYYPMQIRQRTSKQIFVDMGSKPNFAKALK